MSITIMTKKLNVFFIHAQWLKDREKVIMEFNKQLGKYQFRNIKGTKTRVITEFDPNDINGQIIGSTVNYSPIQEAVSDVISPQAGLSSYNVFLKNLHVFQLSNALKHWRALEEISKTSDEDDINLILEDDVLYEDKMCMILENVLAELPAGYEVVFLGLPSNVDAKKRLDVKFQPAKEMFRVLPYCDAYVVSKAAAKKLYENFLPIKFVNNVQLSFVMEKSNTTGLISIPNVFMDGSKFGMFLSVLNPNNNLMFNNDYMRVKMAIANFNELKPGDREVVEKIMRESPFRGHPDFMHLVALYNVRQKKYKDAEAVFEEALKIFQGNSCILNHESQFLKDYILMYRETQVV
jgi:GR25 family glycosyltransferase involved in LPS biosynthesis